MPKRVLSKSTPLPASLGGTGYTIDPIVSGATSIAGVILPYGAVQLYRNDVSLGIAFANVNGIWSLNLTSPASGSDIFRIIGGPGVVVSGAVIVVPTDSTPSAFVFNDISNAALSTVYESNAITIADIDTASPISVTGGEYNKNDGAYTTAAGTVIAGDVVKVRNISSSSNSTPVNVTLTVGGISDTFTITTAVAVPVNPTLRDLAVTSNTATVGTAVNIPFTDRTAGSTFTLSGAGAPGLSVIAGPRFAGTPTSEGPVNITETLANATNSPHTTSNILTVIADASSIPANSLLMEDGTALLLEDNTPLLLEAA